MDAPRRRCRRRLLAALGACLLCAALAPAAPVCRAATAAAPGSIEDLWSRGESAFRAGDLDEALRLFDAALAGNERSARSWNYAGGVHFEKGDYPRALAAFRRALELDPGDVRACNNLATALERTGDYAGAGEAYARARIIDPSYALTLRNLGILQARRLGQPEAARRSWLLYLELAPAGAYADEVRRELSALEDAAAPPR